MPRRDITDIFLPYARPAPPSSIPAKRPSPSPQVEAEISPSSADKQLRGSEPRTPTTASRLRSGLSSPYKPHFVPTPGTPVSIAIRSPRPDPSQKSVHSYTPHVSASSKKPLFASAAKKTKHEDQKVPSFADFPTSSQSIIKDGKRIAVKGSDDEDSDSLCSLDEILGRNRSDPTTGSPSSSDRAAEDLESERASSLSLFTNGRSNALVGRDKLRALTTKANGLKFDISLLVGDHFDDEEIEANVTKTKQRYKDSDQAEQFGRYGVVDKKLLASVVNQEDSGTNLQRLFDAVERTEALATQSTWSMFDLEPVVGATDSSSSSPDTGEGILSAIGSFKDPTLTESTYLTGYLAEKATLGILPDEIFTSIFNSLLGESREDVRQSGLRVLNAAGRRWTSEKLTAIAIEKLFCQLGANPSKVKCASVINAEPHVAVHIHALDKRLLLSAIDMLLGLSASMNSGALSKFVKLLMRLAIDSSLMSQSRICIAVEDAISRLLGHRDEHISRATGGCILEDMGTRIQDPFLQTQLLQHILPSSRPAASLRVRLANRFLLNSWGEKKSPSHDVTSPVVNLEHLNTYLRDPRFNISHSKSRDDSSFDYSTLSSLIYIFDIALADGGRPPPTTPVSSCCSSSSTIESAFNKRIDNLADQVKTIHASIADTGASHLRRTEAKEALNALHFRLLYGVRTKPRPKKPVFGGGARWAVGKGTGAGLAMDGAQSEEEGQRSVDLMRKFLLRNAKLVQQQQEKEKEVEKEKRRQNSGGGVEGGEGENAVSSACPSSQLSDSERRIRGQLGLED